MDVTLDSKYYIQTGFGSGPFRVQLEPLIRTQTLLSPLSLSLDRSLDRASTMAKAKAKAKGSTAHVLRVALFSRVILLTLIALWRLLFSPYDTSASLNPNCLSSSSSPSATAAGGGGGGGDGDGSRSSPPDALALPSAAAAIGSSVVWDGVYFVRIAECGYEYEQSFAFLPLLPVAISLLSRSGEFSLSLFLVKCTRIPSTEPLHTLNRGFFRFNLFSWTKLGNF